MTRFAFLALVAFGLATVPAQAQTPTAAPDSIAADTSETAVQLDPDRARGLYDEGATLLRARDFQNALLKFEQALVFNPSYAAAGLGRAQALAQLRRLEDARSAAEETIAMAEASDASNAGQIKSAAQALLDQVAAVLEQAAAAQAAADAAAGAQATAVKVQQATEILSANDLSEDQAIEAYTLLEQARLDGYDPNLVAFYYAKALNAMGRGADAVPFAETAVTASEGQADRSAYYIQLGLAHMGAGNSAEARTAFEAITDGQAWYGWAQHYIGQLDAEG